jgi:hypothetical protein
MADTGQQPPWQMAARRFLLDNGLGVFVCLENEQRDTHLTDRTGRSVWRGHNCRVGGVRTYLHDPRRADLEASEQRLGASRRGSNRRAVRAERLGIRHRHGVAVLAYLQRRATDQGCATEGCGEQYLAPLGEYDA